MVVCISPHPPWGSLVHCDLQRVLLWCLQVAVSSEEGSFARVTEDEDLGTLGTPEAVFSLREGSF